MNPSGHFNAQTHLSAPLLFLSTRASAPTSLPTNPRAMLHDVRRPYAWKTCRYMPVLLPACMLQRGSTYKEPLYWRCENDRVITAGSKTKRSKKSHKCKSPKTDIMNHPDKPKRWERAAELHRAEQISAQTVWPLSSDSTNMGKTTELFKACINLYLLPPPPPSLFPLLLYLYFSIPFQVPPLPSPFSIPNTPGQRHTICSISRSAGLRFWYFRCFSCAYGTQISDR